MRRTLGELIDFERLNGGDIRLSIMIVDIETGEEIVFDTSRERILLDHVLARTRSREKRLARRPGSKRRNDKQI